jgi:CrcB protein
MPKPTLRLLVRRLPVDPDLDEQGPELPLPMRVALVALGGAAGTLIRAALESLQPTTATWPWVTLAVNLSGAGLLAVVLVLLEESFPTMRVVRPLIGTGLLGGYTTFSTFAVEALTLARTGHAGPAAGYVVASCLGALTMAMIGLAVGRAVSRLANRERWMRQVRHAGALEMAEEPS